MQLVYALLFPPLVFFLCLDLGVGFLDCCLSDLKNSELQGDGGKEKETYENPPTHIHTQINLEQLSDWKENTLEPLPVTMIAS